jgi:hypothetical protein
MPVFRARTTRMLRYYENTLSITATLGVNTSYVFSANGLYDPNVTGTGHQPMGFDEMMLFYNQATVVSSKITVKYYNGSSNSSAAGVALYLNPSATPLSDPYRVMENGYVATTTLNGLLIPGYIKELSLNCDVAQYFGRRSKNVIVNDPNLYTTAAANPTEQVYYVINLWDPFATNTLIVIFSVTIEYTAIFWEPRKDVESLSSRLDRLLESGPLPDVVEVKFASSSNSQK